MVLGICGAGGLGKEVLQLAKEINNYHKIIDKIIFVDDNLDASIISNTEVYGFNNVINMYDSQQLEFIIALGEPKKRKNEYDKIINYGYRLHTLVHPSVLIPEDVSLGQGVIINEKTHISCGDVIGNNVLIQPMACIGHDNKIGSHSVISSQVSFGGNVIIGEVTFIAMGVPIKQGVIIGDNVIVGLGSIIRNNIDNDVVAFGNPMKTIKNNGRWKVFG